MICGNSSRFVVGFGLLVGVLGTVCLLVDTSMAQETPRPKPAATDNTVQLGEKEKSTRLYRVKYAGKLFVGTVQEAIPDARFVFDAGSDRLIVTASPKEHDLVAELLKELDVPPEQGEDLKVFNLAYSDAESMLNVVSNLMRSQEVRYAADSRTNSLLVAGPKRALQVIEAILLRLDEASDLWLLERTFRLRVVWFAEGSADDGRVKLDADLKSVQDELSNIGVEAIRPVGQAIVSIAPEGEFQIGCSTTLGGSPADLEIDGNLDLVQRAPHLAIRISAEREQVVEVADGRTTRHSVRLVQLATEIIAPMGHWVVLGVTPAGEDTLAFAVQVESLD